MRAAERGEEVVEGILIREVYRCQPKTPRVLVAAEEVVVTNRSVEKTARLDPLRVLVVVAGARSRNLHQA